MLRRTTKVNAMLLILLIFFCACFAYIFSSDRNRSAIFGARDYIEKGSKFGVGIGDDRELAVSQLISLGLKKGDNSYTRQYSENGLRTCHGKEFSNEHTIDFYLDRSWRRGNICLASLDGKVVHVSWNYGMFQP